MEYIAGAVIAKNIGIELTLKCISTLTASSHGIYSLLKNIGSTGDADITTILKQLDLEVSVKILETLIKDLAFEIRIYHSQTLSLCVQELKNCVEQIESELKTIKNRLDYNNSLWVFKSMRSYGFIDSIKNITIFKSNLENRKRLLFDVLKVNNHLIPKYSNFSENHLSKSISTSTTFPMITCPNEDDDSDITIIINRIEDMDIGSTNKDYR